MEDEPKTNKMMVSTRGIKFKFSEGEKVLCYEPDPTKAKVLYDSKVLELNVSRDNRGRKVPEYLIHFYGWSSSWDRCVKEEFILPDTQENRDLQTKLAQDAALALKGRRKGKLSPIVKETLSKKENPEDEKEMPATVKNDVQKESSGSDSSDDEETEKSVEIEIPAPLKDQLEEDWLYITQKDKILRIPCEDNVVSILEGYVKHLANEFLSSRNKNSKNGREFNMQNAEAKIHFCKEVMDGLRVYFDFTLPHLLLYRQEKKQFYTVGNTCVPICKFKSEPAKKVQINSDLSTLANICLKDSPKGTRQNHPPHTITRGGLRNQAASHKSTAQQKEEETDASLRSKAPSHVQQTKETPPGAKKTRAIGSREGLRSRDKSKLSDDNSSVGTNSSPSGQEMSSSPTRPESPTTPTSPSRQTRRSSHNASQLQSLPTPSVQLTKSPPNQKRTSSASNVPVTSLLTSLTVCVPNINATAASAHPSPASPKSEKQPVCHPPQKSDPKLLKEVLSWHMLPHNLYEQVPAAPSLIYGPQHLLRLFVKLPELIYKTKMPQKKLGPLLSTLNNFLQYLAERKDDIFRSSSYIDSCEDTNDGHPTLIT